MLAFSNQNLFRKIFAYFIELSMVFLGTCSTGDSVRGAPKPVMLTKSRTGGAKPKKTLSSKSTIPSSTRRTPYVAVSLEKKTWIYLQIYSYVPMPNDARLFLSLTNSPIKLCFRITIV